MERGAGRAAMVGLALLLAAVGAACAPDPGAWFRAEDLVDFEHYGNTPLSDCLTRPHLDTRLVSFYRPLSDALTWGMVRALGPHETPHHLVLLALHWLVALAVYRSARRTFDAGAPAATLAAVFVLVHPFAAMVLCYLDGGVAQLLFSLAAIQAVTALGDQRAGRAGSGRIFGWALVGMLAFDGGLALPLALIAMAVVWGERSLKVLGGLFASLLAVLGLRLAVLGTALGGYGMELSATNLLALAVGIPKAACEVVLPVLGDRHDPSIALVDLHPAWWEWIALTFVVLAVVVAIGISVVRARGEVRGMGRFLALVILFGAVFVPGSLELGLNMGNGAPFAPSFAYRLYPATAVLALAAGCLFGSSTPTWWSLRTGGRASRPPFLLGVAGVVGLVVLGAPFRAGTAEAGERARSVCAAVREHVEANAPGEDDEPMVTVVFGTPLSLVKGPRDMGRVLHYGLSSAFRPPLYEPEQPVFPVFATRGGGDLVVSPASLERLLAAPFLDVVQVDLGSGTVFRPEAGAAPPPAPFQLLPPSGIARDARNGLAEAEVVSVDERGEFRLRVRGETPGVLRLILINRVHPFYAQGVRAPDRPDPGLLGLLGRDTEARLYCERVEDPERDSDELVVAARQFLEVANRDPEGLSFAVLQVMPGPIPSVDVYAATVASEVLAIRLRRED